MNIHSFIQGIAIGLSVSAPIGANGLLCISRSFQDIFTGIVSGLGSATADLMYSCIAGLGVSLLTGKEHLLMMAGGIFLCCMGIKILLSNPPVNRIPVNRVGLRTAYLSALFVALTNPQSIIFFIALFSGVDSIGLEYSISIPAMAIGVFTGAMIWWIFLSGITSLMVRSFTPKVMVTINYLSALVIIAFGLKSLFSINFT